MIGLLAGFYRTSANFESSFKQRKFKADHVDNLFAAGYHRWAAWSNSYSVNFVVGRPGFNALVGSC